MPRSLTDIDADLAAAYASRRAAMAAKSSGRSGLTKTSQDLSQIQDIIRELEAERASAAVGLTGRPIVGGLIR